MTRTTMPPRRAELPLAVGPDPDQPIIRFVEADGSPTELGIAYGIDVDLARDLFRDMTLARRLDREALALQRQGELSLWLMCWGQEAAQVGSIHALRKTDMVFPSYREHAAALVRGVTPAELFSQWRGVSHAGWNPETYRFHIYSLVLGTQTLHATGYAAGAAMEGTDEVVAVYFGDGAASQGDVNEAFNWSTASGLPVLFFCQNNQWAISTPPHLQARNKVFRRAAGFGMPAWHVDGNDALAVHAVTAQAAAGIRKGGGPAVIEAETYRMAGHSSSDDPTRYRPKAELADWERRDPIVRLESLLRTHDTEQSFFDGLATEADELAADARTACKALTTPNLSELFSRVYAVERESIVAEQNAYEALENELGAREPGGHA